MTTNMIHVYVDPSSPAYLRDGLFGEHTHHDRDNVLSRWRYLREYCRKQNMEVHTIDFWDPQKPSRNDVYVSIDHKRFLRKLYWRARDRRYPMVDLESFGRKVLFHFEPPLVMPEIVYGIKGLSKTYDRLFFTWKTGYPNIEYMHTPQIHEGVSPEYWGRTERKFLTMINANRKALFRHRELLTERVRAMLFFAKSGDIDLFGFGWEERPLFPYWFCRGAIQKVYKGSVKDKYEKLSEYTFALIFENCKLPGYITEKLFDCLHAGTIPIYLGAPDVAEYIPRDCFIDMRDFTNYQELGGFLKSLPPTKIRDLKEQGRRFLESEQYKPFRKEYFAEIFAQACA